MYERIEEYLDTMAPDLRDKLVKWDPEEHGGKTVADLMSRRGRILEVLSVSGGQARIVSQVPLRELFGYASSLRSLSGGRGEFMAEPSVYAPL